MVYIDYALLYFLWRNRYLNIKETIYFKSAAYTGITQKPSKTVSFDSHKPNHYILRNNLY